MHCTVCILLRLEETYKLSNL